MQVLRNETSRKEYDEDLKFRQARKAGRVRRPTREGQGDYRNGKMSYLSL